MLFASRRCELIVGVGGGGFGLGLAVLAGVVGQGGWLVCLQGAGAWKAGGGCWSVKLEHGNILFF